MPFANLSKGIVLQETKQFNKSTISARKCSTLLIKILYLLSRGETIGETEATAVFFDITKLFQSNDVKT